jgi:hypothetical protein
MITLINREIDENLNKPEMERNAHNLIKSNYENPIDFVILKH